jgi:hypothetical protein
MTVEKLLASLSAEAPPSGDAPPVLRALWLAHNGDWEAAHTLVTELDTRPAAWLHAFLHRQEGDLANARYWYQRAGRAMTTAPLQEEWHVLVTELVTSDAGD